MVDPNRDAVLREDELPAAPTSPIRSCEGGNGGEPSMQVTIIKVGGGSKIVIDRDGAEHGAGNCKAAIDPIGRISGLASGWAAQI